jgi:hypothetical protein
MKIHDILTKDYQLLTDQHTSDLSFKGCYQTDLLSAAIKSADVGNILITIISSLNTVALAMMIDLPGIIVTEDRKVSNDMIDRANQENIALISTHLKSHEVIIDLYQRGLL